MKTQTQKICCPACDIGMDVTLHEDPEPIFDDHYFAANRVCKCGYHLFVSIVANKKEVLSGD